MENLTFDLLKNVEFVETKFLNNADLIKKELTIFGNEAVIFYFDSLINKTDFNEYVLKPIYNLSTEKISITNSNHLKVLKFLKSKIMLGKLNIETDVNTLIAEISKGNGVLMLKSCNSFITLDLAKMPERAVSEPPTSAVAYGPRVGFNENIKTNISSVRKIISSSSLKIEMLKVGKFTKTNVAITYIDGIADNKIVKKIIQTIKKIDIDGIIDSYYIASFLEEKKFSIFKQVGRCEKPDILSAKLLEGRIGIIVDGSPIVLTLPFMLFEDIQSSNDYYSNYSYSSFVRILRLISILITTTLPGIYIAIQLHHYKAFPLKFLVTIINTTQDLPFTPFLEMLLILILFEILYEASLRMPKYMGIAMSIVGALILGDTAVKAGLVSPPAVMIVAVSGITLYTVPEEADQISILRFMFTLIGGMLGIYGMVLFGLFILIYLNDFSNFGVSYLSPYAPYYEQDTKDGVFKRDLLQQTLRPKSLHIKNRKRIRNEKRINK